MKTWVNGNLGSVQDELSHKFQDGGSECWVMVPSCECLLQ